MFCRIPLCSSCSIFPFVKLLTLMVDETDSRKTLVASGEVVENCLLLKKIGLFNIFLIINICLNYIFVCDIVDKCIV